DRPVVDVGRGHPAGERDPAAVGQQVVLAPGLPAVGGVRAGVRPPKTARTLELSITARDQSSLPALSSRSRSAAWIFSQVPSAGQAASLRQQLIPDPQLISAGRSSHGSPVLRTNRMPVSACRWVIGGRPPFGEGGGNGGSNGSMSAHNSSGSSWATAVPLRRTPPDSDPGMPLASFR